MQGIGICRIKTIPDGSTVPRAVPLPFLKLKSTRVERSGLGQETPSSEREEIRSGRRSDQELEFFIIPGGQDLNKEGNAS